MSSRRTSRSRGAAVGALVLLAVLAGCSGNELSASDPDATTTTPAGSKSPTTSAPDTSASEDTAPGSTVAPGQTQPRPTTTVADAESLPGLWLSLGRSINDERGTVYATSSGSEELRSPVDDGNGGVIYLRCPEEEVDCEIERVTEPDGEPVPLGRAGDLLAVGTLGGAPVLISSWQDPAVQPDFASDTSGVVARVIDLSTGSVVQTYDWFGWESGPFVADVESDQFVLCVGEGAVCGLSLRSGDGAAADQPFADVAAAEVSSMALDPSGKVATWVTTDPGSGATDVVVRELAGATTDRTSLLGADEPRATATDTDGTWVALLVGERIQLREIAGARQRGQLVAPPGVVAIALRTPAGGSSGPSPL